MNFVTFQSVPYIAHVETEVLYNEIGNLASYFTTNKSNKVKGTVTNSETSRYFERLTKYDRFKYLLKELDPAFLTVCGKWFHKLGSPITKEHFVCVCVHAGTRSSACVCLYMHASSLCVCMYACVIACVCLYTCVRVWFLLFIICKDTLRSVSLNNKVLFSLQIYLLSFTCDFWEMLPL